MPKGMMKHIRIRKKFDGRIYALDIDYGPKGLIPLENLENGHEIWKQPGHLTWAGVGQGQRYVRTWYILVKVYGKDGDTYYDEVWEEEYCGRKKTVKLLKEKLKEILENK